MSTDNMAVRALLLYSSKQLIFIPTILTATTNNKCAWPLIHITLKWSVNVIAEQINRRKCNISN
jgi:hypothetical protein